MLGGDIRPLCMRKCGSAIRRPVGISIYVQNYMKRQLKPNRCDHASVWGVMNDVNARVVSRE